MDNALVIPAFFGPALVTYVVCCVFALTFDKLKEVSAHFSVVFVVMPIYTGKYLAHSSMEWLILGVLGVFGSRLGWQLFRYVALRIIVKFR